MCMAHMGACFACKERKQSYFQYIYVLSFAKNMFVFKLITLGKGEINGCSATGGKINTGSLN